MNADKPLSEQYRIISLQWADAEGAANMLEETKSAVLSKMMVDLGDMPVSRAEMQVKASDAWREHITQMVKARSHASHLKVEMEFIRMRFMEWQSHAATRRAEMKL
jgi:hypothetical protein